MKRKVKKRVQRLLTLVLVACFMMAQPTEAVQVVNGVNSTINTYYDGGYSIMGPTTVTIGQMINYYQANQAYPAFYANTDAPNIYVFCMMYMEECNAEGVRAEVAFAQAMKETGFLRYKGDVHIEQFNFAGLGATGGGNPGNSFSTVRMGIRAQVQHLKAYATSEPLNQEVVDPRYSLVNKGSAPYVEWLGKHENPTGIGWATAWGYGTSIVNDYIARMRSYSTYSTWYQGVNYEAVYNPDYYMLHNPDVAAVCGGSSDSLLSHFLNYGMKEGRQGIVYFDVNSYKRRYKDLRMAFGNDLKSYYLHYVYSGQNEHRIASGPVDNFDAVTVYNGVDYASVYDYNYYIKEYPDIRAAFGDDDLAVLAHFVNYGMAEGRRGNAAFDVNSYKNAYSDLREAFGNDLRQYYLHYIYAGKSEKRRATGVTTLQNPLTKYNGVDYSSVYDYNYYIKHNPDVRAAFGMDDVAVLAHFVNYGMSEGRRGNEAFDVNSYRNAYSDLRAAFGMDLRQYYLHYMSAGKSENRVATGVTNLANPLTTYNGVDYSSVYDYNYYITRYPDIKAAFGNDDRAVLAHFVNYGMAEGRRGNETFDVAAYRNKYADLQQVFGNDWKGYYEHYVQYGRAEGR